METKILIDVTGLKGDTAECSFTASPPTWPCSWVRPDGEINTPGTANVISLELPLDTMFRFVGIRILPEVEDLLSAPVHKDGPIPGTPFRVSIGEDLNTLTLDESQANWQGWKSWRYSIGIADDSENVYWCDPMIYNKGDG